MFKHGTTHAYVDVPEKSTDRQPTRVLPHIMCSTCFYFSKYVYFMSFGRSFREVMSFLCPLQITVMGLSIKYLSDKREEVKENRPPV